MGGQNSPGPCQVIANICPVFAKFQDNTKHLKGVSSFFPGRSPGRLVCSPGEDTEVWKEWLPSSPRAVGEAHDRVRATASVGSIHTHGGWLPIIPHVVVGPWTSHQETTTAVFAQPRAVWGPLSVAGQEVSFP